MNKVTGNAYQYGSIDFIAFTWVLMDKQNRGVSLESIVVNMPFMMQNEFLERCSYYYLMEYSELLIGYESVINRMNPRENINYF